MVHWCGGLASEVKEIISENKMKDVTIKSYGYPDVFVEHATPSQIEKKYKIDEDTIFYNIKKTIKKTSKQKYNKINKSQITQKNIIKAVQSKKIISE